jgi:predicted histone-like DNA-binding protein
MTKYILQEMADGMGNGKKSLYPKMQTYSLHDFETVIRHMHDYAGSFGEGTIRGVIDALVSVMERWMPMGHTIKIDGLGVFSLSLGFDESMPSEKAAAGNPDKESKTNYRHVCIKGINFKPDAKLLQKLNEEASFERAESGVKVPQKAKYNSEERLSIARGIIAKHCFMTLQDYANATGQCRAAASRDLKRIVAESDSGIKTRGSHSHKVWVSS